MYSMPQPHYYSKLVSTNLLYSSKVTKVENCPDIVGFSIRLSRKQKWSSSMNSFRHSLCLYLSPLAHCAFPSNLSLPFPIPIPESKTSANTTIAHSPRHCTPQPHPPAQEPFVSDPKTVYPLCKTFTIIHISHPDISPTDNTL